jgi:hypothetical protein
MTDHSSLGVTAPRGLRGWMSNLLGSVNRLPAGARFAVKALAVLGLGVVGILLITSIFNNVVNPIANGLGDAFSQILENGVALVAAAWVLSTPVEKVIMLGVGAIVILLLLIFISIADRLSAAKK